MTEQQQKLITQKIDELLELAKQTKSPFLLVFQERNTENGRHLSAYGSGLEIRDLLQETVNHNPDVKKIIRNVITF